MINLRLIVKTLGFIAVLVGLFMLLPAIVGLCYNSPDWSCFVLSAATACGLGGLMLLVKPTNKRFHKREGYLVVAMGWLMMCVVGALPYIFHLDTISIVDAFFESCSGFTTTGASIFSDIESLPKGILFWRSLTQWLGGMGIIAFTMAIFPLLGIGSVELFAAEAPGPPGEKVLPRISSVSRTLWLMYIGLTFVLYLILDFVSGMDSFDAVNHAMTTLSTGGFSTKNDSLAHFDTGWVQYPIILFMFIGGINYSVLYYFLRGRFKLAMSSEEIRFYIIFTFCAILAIMAILGFGSIQYPNFEELFRDVAFQVVSLITTTGFVTADYLLWGTPAVMLCFILLFAGACAGSTSGGIKMVRHIVFMKNGILEYKRMIHPRAYVRLKLDNHLVSGKVVFQILVFLLFYLILFVIGSFMVTLLIPDNANAFATAIGAVASCIGNVGPGIGDVGPMYNYAFLPDSVKVILSALMVIGRLEILTIMILFSPYFWKHH